MTAELLRAMVVMVMMLGDQDHATETLLTRDISSEEIPPSENTEEVYEVSKCLGRV